MARLLSGILDVPQVLIFQLYLEANTNLSENWIQKGKGPRSLVLLVFSFLILLILIHWPFHTLHLGTVFILIIRDILIFDIRAPSKPLRSIFPCSASSFGI